MINWIYKLPTYITEKWNLWDERGMPFPPKHPGTVYDGGKAIDPLIVTLNFARELEKFREVNGYVQELSERGMLRKKHLNRDGLVELVKEARKMGLFYFLGGFHDGLMRGIGGAPSKLGLMQEETRAFFHFENSVGAEKFKIHDYDRREFRENGESFYFFAAPGIEF